MYEMNKTNDFVQANTFVMFLKVVVFWYERI